MNTATEGKKEAPARYSAGSVYRGLTIILNRT